MNEKKTRFSILINSDILPLIFILTLSVIFRIIYQNGVIYHSDFEHVALANRYSIIIRSLFDALLGGSWSEIAHVFNQLRTSIQSYGFSSSISYLPVSISYAIFGISDYSGLIFPITCSLIGTLLMYGTGTLLVGRKAGLVSAFIWSVLPVEIYYSTIISTVLPSFMLSQASIFLFLLSNHTLKNKNFYIFINILCLTILFFINPTSLAITGFFLVYWARKYIDKKIFIIGLIVFYLSFIIIYCIIHNINNFPQALFHLYQSASHEGGWLIIFPLFLSGVVGFSYKQNSNLSIPFLWLGSIYPILSLITFSDTGIEKSLLIFYAPIVTAIAILLTNIISINLTKIIILINTISLGFLVWLSGSESFTDILLHQQATLSPTLILSLSSIVSGIAFIGAITSNVFVTGCKKIWKGIAVSLLLWMLGFSMVQPVNYTNRYARHVQLSSIEAYDFIRNSDNSTPVFLDDEIIIERIKYLSGFQMDNLKLITGKNQEIYKEVNSSGGSYIILSSNSNIIPEENWLPVRRIGKTWFNSYWIYRSISIEDAQKIISDNQIKSSNKPTQKSKYFNLYGAYINSENFCKGYDAWIDYAKYSDQIEFIPIIKNDCFEYQGENIIDPYTFNYYPYSYGLVNFRVTAEKNIDLITYHKKKYSDLNTIFQYIDLKPNTFYYLEFSVRSDDTQTMIVPYLIIGNQDLFLEAGKYPEWKMIRMIFKTPDTATETITSYVSPFLFEGSHISYFKDFRIMELSLD